MSRRRSRWSVEVWKLIDRSNLQIKDLEPLCAAGHHRLSLLEGGRVEHCEKARFVADLYKTWDRMPYRIRSQVAGLSRWVRRATSSSRVAPALGRVFSMKSMLLFLPPKQCFMSWQRFYDSFVTHAAVSIRPSLSRPSTSRLAPPAMGVVSHGYT